MNKYSELFDRLELLAEDCEWLYLPDDDFIDLLNVCNEIVAAWKANKIYVVN